jgi:hypothetical protein
MSAGTITPTRPSPATYWDAEALQRLEAVRLGIDTILAGRWWPDDVLFAALLELLTEARRRARWAALVREENGA